MIVHRIYLIARDDHEKFENREEVNLINCIKKNIEYKIPSNTNPLANTLLTSLPSEPNPIYNDNQNYTKYKSKKAPPSFNEKIKKKINKKSKNIRIKDKLSKDLGNTANFNIFMRQFYTMPNTEVPSNQREFAEFCYGDMDSRKTVNDFTK